MSALSDLRKDYKLRTLGEEDVLPDAIAQFKKWWQEALDCEIEEPNAMALSTVDEEGAPSSRIVLLKDFDEEGFTFYTNYDSHKAHDIMQHNRVALLFFWKELERQVRIEGSAEKIAAAESDAYFKSRPQGSKIGAWASPQSRVIENRQVLETKVAETEKKFENTEVERPANWGGYIVHPGSIEFWQGRSSRLHDRLKYSRENKDWKIVRLAP